VPALEEPISVTVKLAPGILARVEQSAAIDRATFDTEIAALIEEGLDARLSTRELFEQLSRVHRVRISQEGKLHQTKEELLEELRDSRQRVADELYPR